jgi:hypothetical protein
MSRRSAAACNRIAHARPFLRVILAFDPGQLVGHLVQLMAQRADQLHSLGGIAVTHDEIGPSLLSSTQANRRESMVSMSRPRGAAVAGR